MKVSVETSFLLWQRHTLHLNLHALRQLFNSNTTPCRTCLPKMLLILSIHLRKILHIRQKDRHLHHLGYVAVCGLQYIAQVLDT